MRFINSVVNADGHISDMATATRALQRALSTSSQTIIKYAKAYIKKWTESIEILNTALTITRSVPKTVVGQPDRLQVMTRKLLQSNRNKLSNHSDNNTATCPNERSRPKVTFIILQGTAQHNKAQHSTAQHNTAPLSAPLLTVEYNIVPRSTVPHSAHSTAQHTEHSKA